MISFFRRKPHILFVRPAILIMAAITIFPMIFGLRLSFMRYNLARPWIPKTFIGFRNFIDFLEDEYLQKALWVTLKFTVASVSIQLLTGILAALAIHHLLRKDSLIRYMVLLPMVVVPVVTGLIWRLILNDGYGVVNWLLQQIGVAPRLWLGPDLALSMIVLVEVWQWLPFSILLFTVGLEAIPKDYYEAAAVDGARIWQTFIHITLPNLRWTFLIILVFKSSDAIKAFDVIYPLTGGGPGIITRTLALYIQDIGFTDFEIGYAMALSLLILAISSIIIGPMILKLDKR